MTKPNKIQINDSIPNRINILNPEDMTDIFKPEYK